MPLLRKGILLPVQGIDYSIPAKFIPERGGFPQNMRFDKGEMRKRPGKSALGLQISDASQIMGIGVSELSTGSKHLIRNSKTLMERYNTSTSAWESIAATAFTGGDEDFFHYAMASEDDLLIATNGVDVIRKWSGSGNVASLGGSPPLAKFCAYLSPYVLLAHLTEGGDILPWAIDWSDTNAPEVWSGGNSGRWLLSDEPSPIQNIAKLNDLVSVYKKGSLGIGYKVETTDIFQFKTIKTGVGLFSPRAFVDAVGRHYFMAHNDFYVWNGIREESIGGPVRDEVFSRVDRNKAARCFAIHVEELTEVWFFVVIVGYDWPTEVWKYNYRTGFWYFDTCSEITAALKWEKVATESWDDDDSGTWDEATDVWDSGTSVQAWEDIVFGDSAGKNYTLDYTTTNDAGVAVAAHFITKDFVADQLEFMKEWLQLDVWLKGVGQVLVDYSIDEGSNWTNIPWTPSQAYVDADGVMTKYELYFHVVAEKIRFRFRNARAGEIFYLQNFYPYYLSKEPIQTKRD